MEDLIASYLVQKKECALPLLGNFRIATMPASLDIVNKQLFAPSDEILFSESGDYVTEGLIAYISNLDKVSLNDAEEKINNWCLHTKVKLDAGEKIIFNSVGSLQKNAAGNIFFQRKNGVNFYEAIPAERVIHKNAEHAVLVGDKETTSAAMNEFYSDENVKEKKATWKIWSIVLLAISVLFLFFYFYTHQFSETGIGNHSSFPVQESPAASYNAR